MSEHSGTGKEEFTPIQGRNVPVPDGDDGCRNAEASVIDLSADAQLYD